MICTDSAEILKIADPGDAVECAIRLKCVECLEKVVGRADTHTLSWALKQAVHYFPDAVEVLLKAGARPDPELLYVAARKRDARTIELLLQYGAKVSAVDKSGSTPLDAAAEAGCAQCVDALLRHGARPTSRTLRLTISREDHYEDRRRILFAILQHLHEPVLRKKRKCRFFREAVRRGDVGAVLTLVNLGLSPKKCRCVWGLAPDLKTLSVLGPAECVRYKDIRSVDVLRKVVEDLGPRHADRDGLTPLHAAARLCDAELLRQLLEAGADVNKTDRWGRTPLYYAVESGCAEAVVPLIQYGARPSPEDLVPAAYRGDVALVSLLLHHAPEAARGVGPLHAAAAGCSAEIAALLLRYGADPNARNERGRTPLHIAARTCCADVALLMLEHGADVTVRDIRGKTPLQYACPEIIQRLVERFRK
jgi:ankyrin repeat protein